MYKMKKLAFILILTLFSTPMYAQNTMKMVYFHNFPPFSWEDDNKQMQGILIDVINESIHARMGISVSHKGYPWARAQYMVKHNRADAFVTVPTPKRREYTKISKEPAVIATFTLFIKDGNPKIWDLKNVKKISDLKRFKIGSYIGNGWADKNLAGIDVDLGPTLDTTLNKLIKGRFDVYPGVSQVTRHRIRELDLQNEIIELPNIIDSSTFNLCIGKKSPYVNILPKFDETVRKMRDDGKLQEIYETVRKMRDDGKLQKIYDKYQ